MSKSDFDQGRMVDLENLGFYFMFDDIDSIVAKDLIKWILEKNIAGDLEILTLVICSGGGCINSTFAMIDAIKGSEIPVRTIGIGIVGSAALMMFMSGAIGHRILTPNTSILSHQFWWGSVGKEHELFAAKREHDLMSMRIIEHYKKCTSLKEKEIKSNLLPPHDVWLSAEEALKFKLCDHVQDLY